MLTVAKLHRGAERYYFATVAGHAMPAGLVEADPVFRGAGCASLGLSGRPEPAQLRALLAGRHPASGELLLSHARRDGSVYGFDVVASAPKSVSLLQALAEPAVSERVKTAHESALAALLSLLEAEVLTAVKKRGGARLPVAVEGAVAVAFLHRTSRAGDPHLHSHLVIANLGRDQDGAFRSLDARPLYRGQRPLRLLYESQLRAELSSLGLEFEPPRRGHADLAAISQRAVRDFSRQSARIAAALARGQARDSKEAALVADLVRPPKELSRSYRELQEEWRSRAHENGLSRRRLRQAAGEGRPPGREVSPTAWAESASCGIDATCSLLELMAARAASAPSGRTIEGARSDVARAVAQGAVRRAGDRYLVVASAARLAESSRNLAGCFEGLAVGVVSYEPGRRLAGLDQLACLARAAAGESGAVLAVAAGERAARYFAAASGIATHTPAELETVTCQPGAYLVLADCASLGEGELVKLSRWCNRGGARPLLFGDARLLERALLLGGVLSLAEPAPRRERDQVALAQLVPADTSGRVGLGLAGSPSAACAEAARLAGLAAASGRETVVLVPDRSFRSQVVRLAGPGVAVVAPRRGRDVLEGRRAPGRCWIVIGGAELAPPGLAELAGSGRSHVVVAPDLFSAGGQLKEPAQRICERLGMAVAPAPSRLDGLRLFGRRASGRDGRGLGR